MDNSGFKLIQITLDEHSTYISDIDDDILISEKLNISPNYADMPLPEFDTKVIISKNNPLKDVLVITGGIRHNGTAQIMIPLKDASKSVNLRIMATKLNYDKIVSVLDKYGWKHQVLP
jgi:hypothetical protein